MSNIEEKMLEDWKKLNRDHPPAEHLGSACIEDGFIITSKKDRSIRKSQKIDAMDQIRISPGHNGINEERNKRILRLHEEGFTYQQIAEITNITKNVVTGVVMRHNIGESIKEDIKDVGPSDISFSKNTRKIKYNTEDTHVLKHKKLETIIKERQLILIKIFLEDEKEYTSIDHIVDIHWKDRELPKNYRGLLRKYIRQLRSVIEPIGLTIVNKPYSGYKLVAF